MRFGIDVPNIGDYSDPLTLADLALVAEESGWEGFFIWDHLSLGLDVPIADPWVVLAAIAMRTQRIRIGTMVTPLPRRRPWKLARETVSVDHLSGGRLTLGIGVGDPSDKEFEPFGEEGSRKIRARMLDEGLDVLAGLWSGTSLQLPRSALPAGRGGLHATPGPVSRESPSGSGPSGPTRRRCAERRAGTVFSPSSWTRKTG